MVLKKFECYMYKNQTGMLSYTIHRKTNSKWIKNLNVKLETITPRSKQNKLLSKLICRVHHINARLDEAQARIKIAGRNINSLRHADESA